MADELVDVYDIDENHIGTAMKSKAHLNGLWHKNIHCWIFDPEKRLVMFQLRSADKEHFPNCLDISVAGHVGAGDDETETCVREIKEEIGMSCSADDLRYIGMYKVGFRAGVVTNCEFCYIYLFPTQINIDEFVFQEEEVSGAFVASLDDCFKLFSDEVSSISVKGVEQGKDGVTTRDMSMDDFTPFSKGYFMSVMIMIERMIEGKKYIGMG